MTYQERLVSSHGNTRLSSSSRARFYTADYQYIEEEIEQWLSCQKFLSTSG